MSSTNPLLKTAVITRMEGNIVSDMDGEKVMLSVRQGKYYNLGEIGGRIWELLQTPLTIGALVDELTAEYEIPQDECLQQVSGFIRQLKAENLVTVAQ